MLSLHVNMERREPSKIYHDMERREPGKIYHERNIIGIENYYKWADE